MKYSKHLGLIFIGFLTVFSFTAKAQNAKVTQKPYAIVGTNQTTFYNNKTETTPQQKGDDFYGQNANYLGNAPKYNSNGDGTVTDLVTGLTWQQSFDHNGDGKIDVNDKLSYNDILKLVENGVSFAGYNDWRLPTIKEMYSLIMFSGKDTAPQSKTTEHQPFIDNTVFDFAYGDVANGERIIDVQCATTSVYKNSEVEPLIFGVNFADGRIKGYGNKIHGNDKKFNYLLVRGNTNYGKNDFKDNNNSTITDNATGLMWAKSDSKKGMLWQDALKYAENAELAGYTDWRLPDAKELQSLVDYNRSPTATQSAAINSLFESSEIKNEANQTDYPWYWSSTTHASEKSGEEGGNAIYVAFGRAMGYMNKMSEKMPPPRNGKHLPPPPYANGKKRPKHKKVKNGKKNWIDVHGAGAQRSDPKTGKSSDYPEGEGPQGDAKRIYNYVRLVRNVK